MLLRKLFGSKFQGKSKKEKETKSKDANVIDPSYSAKTTTAPPPLSLDAAVFTESLKEIPKENVKEISNVMKDEKKGEDKEEIKDDKSTSQICNLQTCTKEKCSPQTCNKSAKESSQLSTDNKISPTKLTAMINSSIKEAMETIVKQCRMDEKLNVEKKHNREPVKTICAQSKKTGKSKRTMQDIKKHLKHSKSARLAKKSINAPVCLKKSQENNVKKHSKKGAVCEPGKKKKHTKSRNNVKTDNRRMTGNVNIYICSEANENAQVVAARKKPEICTESSSETTEQSSVASSKLVTCIRNKRRKLKEQNSFVCVPETVEDSDHTICTSKYTNSNSIVKMESSRLANVYSSVNEDVCVTDTSSTLFDCKCKDISALNNQGTSERSDSSIERLKIVPCNKIEQPRSTVYTKCLSNSESDGWTSKSTCSNAHTDSVPSDNWSLEANFNDRFVEDDKRTTYKRNLGGVCVKDKNNQEFSNKFGRCKKHSARNNEKENSAQDWSTCNCIAEEEEENVYVDCVREESRKSIDEGMQKIEDSEKLIDAGVHREFPEDRRISSEEVRKQIPDISEEVNKRKMLDTVAQGTTEEVETTLSGQQAVQQSMHSRQGQPMFTRGRLRRPEVLLLKNILKHQTPDADQKGVASSSARTMEIPDGTNGTQVPPDILKKFNLQMLQKYQKQSSLKEEDAAVEDNEKEKTLKDKESEKDKGRKGFQAWLKEILLSKCLKRIIGKSGDRATKLEGSSEKDKTDEAIPVDENTDTNVEDRKKEVSGVPLEEERKIEVKGMYKERDKFEGPRVQYIRKEHAKDNPNIVPSTVAFTDNTEERNITKSGERNEIEESAVIEPKKKSPLLLRKIMKESVEAKRSEKFSKLTDSEETMAKQEDHEVPKERQFISNFECQRKLDPEFQKTRSQCENNDRKMYNDPHSDGESITVCTRYNSEESQSNESRQSRSCKLEPRGMSHDAKCIKHLSSSMHSTNAENICNCCCLPTSQCNNESPNYPKSCLKKTREFCDNGDYGDRRESPCLESRNWKECACKRMVICNGCHRLRPEGSCRLMVTCTNCCEPKSKCNCKSAYDTNNSCGYMKSMFCLYCDKPRDRCTCTVPVRKCSCCALAVDLCMCKDQKTICDGRPVLADTDNDRVMYVTAWKPREEVRRYFSRSFKHPQNNVINECCCCEKLKPHNSDGLPYQRLSVFSDVMDELQHKISESTCCARCKKVPCCCTAKVERVDETEKKKIFCVSPKSRRKATSVCVDKSNNKLSNTGRCEPCQPKCHKSNKTIVPLYCACKMTPCKCRKSKSCQRKPKAKCYYCKNLPCACTPSSERSKPRPCRCTDSPCCTKEKESAPPYGKASTKSKSNDEKTICVR